MTDPENYCAGDPAMRDLAGRRAQAMKIQAVIADFASSRQIPEPDLTAWRCLDVGCSTGVITHALAARHGMAVGLDLDQAALRYSPAQWNERTFPLAASAVRLPCRDGSFDLVVCNQVYQYVSDVAMLLAEIHRVLRPHGICFFGARNLWGLIAPENRLPWLVDGFGHLAGGLGRRMTDWLDRQALRNNWRHTAGRLWPYRKLRALAGRYFTVIDYTTRVLSDPTLASVFLATDRPRKLARLANPLLPLVKPFLPTHLWILEKVDQPSTRLLRQ
ncbi:MAG: class I SAM-dependent methyltransferase [Anaerolineae bacterium]